MFIYRYGIRLADPNFSLVVNVGDMKNEENLLSWLLTEKDPSADFIEDMEGEALVRVIKDSDAIAVYFCKLHLMKFHALSSGPQF